MKKMILGVLLTILGFRMFLYSMDIARIEASGAGLIFGLSISGMYIVLIIGVVFLIAGIVICVMEAYRKDK